MSKSTKKVNKTYLDYASSVFPNSGSIHKLGVEAKKKLENARSKVARVLNARTSEIIFTSGGTESNNLAIMGIVWAWYENNSLIILRINKKGNLPHIITTNIEHPSVLETFRMLEKRKLAEISVISVEQTGIIDVKKIRKEIKKNTILVSVMYANNEIGTIQPIKEIAKEIRHYKKVNLQIFPVFHIDAIQAVNYLDLNVARLGVDLLSISGSKIEGAGSPRFVGEAGRVGVLYKKTSVHLVNIMGGGDQEGGLRPGTENLSEILKFSQALDFAERIKEKEVKRLVILQNYFIKRLNHSNIGADFGMIINGSLENRLPNNINITIPKIPSDLLVIELSAKGIYISSKSACKEGDCKASHVIQAIRKDTDLFAKALREMDGSLRFSFGRDTDKKDIDYTIKSLEQILIKLKKWYTPTPIKVEIK